MEGSFFAFFRESGNCRVTKWNQFNENKNDFESHPDEKIHIPTPNIIKNTTEYGYV